MDDTSNTEHFVKEEPRSTILLVDDNPANLEVLNGALGGLGFRLLIAKSGGAALKIAEKNQPAVVLLDIDMPGMDGFEVCRRLKAEAATRDAMVIFLSARDGQEDKVAGLELGAIDYIEKPFNADELVARVKGHEVNYRRQQVLRRQNAELKKMAGQSFRKLDAAAIADFMAAGESERVEFKSTLRQNLHTQKHGKEIENASLKTIAAYLNSNGGLLLIGVRDDGSTHGLEADGFPNDDRFLLHLKNLVRDYIGIQFARYLDISLHPVGAGQVCAVQCLPSQEPVFFRRDNQEFFYVRVGPSTQALSPSQLLAYLQTRNNA